MNPDITGGAAFPCLPPEGAAGYPYPDSGMTLRDYFAAKAMQGMLANPQSDYSPMTKSAVLGISADAWAVADAMIAAKNAL
jgi:hypothetical protein